MGSCKVRVRSTGIHSTTTPITGTSTMSSQDGATEPSTHTHVTPSVSDQWGRPIPTLRITTTGIHAVAPRFAHFLEPDLAVPRFAIPLGPLSTHRKEIHTMPILRSIIFIANVMFLGVLLFFVGDLKWRNEEDRFSICGFLFMILTILVDMVMILRF